MAVFIWRIILFLLIVLITGNQGSEEVLTASYNSLPRYSDNCINGSRCLHVLQNLSDHSVLNITCNVQLSSIIKLTNLTNITITGHNSPTIDCSNNGGLHFTSCSNVTIEGIIWKQHGSSLNGSFLLNFSTIRFRRHSKVIFNEFSPGNPFALYNHSNLTFEDDSTATFNDSGVIYLRNYSSITCNGNSTVVFIGIRSIHSEHYGIDDVYAYGSAIYLKHYSSIIFDQNSNISFSSNTLYRGAIHSEDHSNIIYKGDSKTVFFNNTAVSYGGAIYSHNHSSVTFEENTEVSFIHNEANEGGAIFSKSNCSIIFTEYSRVTIKENIASSGGALRSHTNSIIVFNENTRVTLFQNVANVNGGAMDLFNNTDVAFKGNSNVIFDSNTAKYTGGAFVCYSKVSFIDKATVNFVNNKAYYGGGFSLVHSFNAKFEKAQVTFSNNTANFGAAIWMLVRDTDGKINFFMQGIGKINFYNNKASILGKSILMDTNRYMFNRTYFTEHALGITNYNISQLNDQQDGLREHIITTPYNIALKSIKEKPVICNDLNNINSDCKSFYLLNAVMLGQELSIIGVVYDFLNNSIPVETDFEIYKIDQNTDYSVQFVNQDSSQGFNIKFTGAKITSNYNCSLELTTLRLHSHIPIQLTIQLSPCYLGFQHSNESMKCECYDREDIVQCDEIISNIRRGYWLGIVEGKVTATTCPINFCDFTCCETSNGYHSLSPDREDQCTSHRSGIACGSCEEGYTLSYGADCVSADKCTAGWTILVVTLTILYWIAIVIGAFAMMHYKLPIGYLYALTYYYSLVDVLLGQYLHLYSSLHTTTDILSSVFNLSPQFLGQLCLAKGLSGVDVYFIHYIHPLVILLILIKIVLLARCSQRLSLFIAKGIIHVICLLLLLSYTSILTISLLLIRSLTFYDIDKIYTYLSPDIEYFHGRHLVYCIVAVICVLTVVVGLPLILLLEPFLNRKINFTKIKPLLDQFQGCFKDRYRWFASYYMICRLVQITVVVYSSDFFITQYILIVTSIIVSLIHVVVRPYNNNTLNIFDGIVLHLMTFVATFPVFDSFNSTLIIFVLIILPLVIFFIMGSIMHKEVIRLLFMICKPKNTEHAVKEENDNEGPMQKFDIIVDESMRKNATICDM